MYSERYFDERKTNHDGMNLGHSAPGYYCTQNRNPKKNEKERNKISKNNNYLLVFQLPTDLVESAEKKYIERNSILSK